MKLDGGATFLDGGTRRIALWRKWGHGPRALLVGLNPSTAGALGKEDQSTRKFRGYLERWGFGGYILENLFDYCATHPKSLYDSRLVLCRPDNLSRIWAASRDCSIVVCCWGRHGRLRQQDKKFLGMLRGTPTWKKLRAFKINANGSPAHPLMLPYSLAPVIYNPEET